MNVCAHPAWFGFDGADERDESELYFDPDWYRARYPDAAAGRSHYLEYGRPDRSPHWLFIPQDYLGRLAAATSATLPPEVQADPYDHFLRIGQHRGLSGHPLFDPTFFLARAPYDVARYSARDGPFTTFLRLLRAGARALDTSPHFDAAWYRDCYPAAAAGPWQGPLHHYLTNPTPTEFDPSPRFSEVAYLAACPDVAATVGPGGFRNGFDHFLRHGAAEARYHTPSGQDPFATDPVPPVSAALPLRVRGFDSLVFLPCARAASPKDYGTFGVLDRSGVVVPEFAHPWLRPRPFAGAVARVPGTCIYGGVLMDHFGHVLRDALARLLFIRERPDLPVLWHHMDGLPVPHDAWPGWLDQLWRLLGLDRHRHLHITAPIGVERVLLPDPGVTAYDVLHPAQARALAARHCPTPPDDARVWLSRAGLPERFGGFAGEAEVEARLATQSWRIARPETLSVAAQADLFATARVVAGTIGSAFHAALLGAAPRAGLVLVHRPGIEHMFYDAVARARGLRQTYVVPALVPGSTFHPWARFTLADPVALADAVTAAAGRVG